MTELSEQQIQNKIICPRCDRDYTNSLFDLMQIKSDGHCQLCRAELSGKFAAGQLPKPFFKATLPMPPSVNHYWAKSVKRKRPVRGKPSKPYVHVFLSAKAIKFKDDVVAQVADLSQRSKPIRTHNGRIKAVVTLHGTDKRSYDVDNRCKGLFDALTKAMVYKDDSQIDELIVKRGEIIKGGQVDVELYEITQSLQK